ncbi:MAG: OsmC family protein [Alicyclobacillus herbarius]|uniref:OsmC family protein n=1 Tax=Alicyclobacillus herbarius TaxID=122960 RepID=UPI00041639D2|nr:OsmC family protein [Alicyclobacillus herbarius]MCL6631533.1 OsmC family protein [Alicyclobacillus herbarius]
MAEGIVRVTANWLGGRHFAAVGPSNFRIDMDAAADVGGQGLGVRPMELLLMGLIGCTGIDVTMILERMRQSVTALHIEAQGVRRAEYPQKFTDIHLYYHLQGEVSPTKAWRAIHLSEEKYCSASASLNANIIPHLILNGTEVPDSGTPASQV